MKAHYHKYRNVFGNALILLMCLSVNASAQIVVRSIRFSMESPQNGGAAWIEIAVQIEARQGTKSDDASPFIDDVRIEVSLATQNGRTNTLQFYQSSAEIATLEAHAPVSVHFYLPPEIIMRDRLTIPLFAAMVKLFAGGNEIPATANNFTGALSHPEHRISFQKRVATEAIQNDGILLPIYETPFFQEAGDRTMHSRLPSYRRRSKI